MSKIIIQRTSENFNRLRDYRIYIDGEKIGTVADGETKDFVISEGQHSIIAKIDWASSPEISFDIKDSETEIFKVGGFKGGNQLILIMTGLAILYFILKVLLQTNIAILLLLPAALVLVYYITIGRKKYLTLTKIEPGDLEKDKIGLTNTDNK